MEHVDELIAAHALHALDPDDERAVEMHLAGCERCRLQLAEFEAVAATLAYAAPQASPPPDLRQRIMAAVEPVVTAPAEPEPALPPPRARRRVGWWPRFSAVAMPAMAAAVIGLLVWNVSLRSDLSGREVRSAVALPEVGSLVSYRSGNVTLYADLAPAPEGKVYEAWVIGSTGKPLPAGIFEGGGTVKLELTEQAHPGDTIAVTVEPDGGSEQPTSDPFAAQKV